MQQQIAAASSKVNWPDMFFGPVNLYSLPPAWFFYLSNNEKKELLLSAQHGENV